MGMTTMANTTRTAMAPRPIKMGIMFLNGEDEGVITGGFEGEGGRADGVG
jgi:hypothetical protein